MVAKSAPGPLIHKVVEENLNKRTNLCKLQQQCCTWMRDYVGRLESTLNCSLKDYNNV